MGRVEGIMTALVPHVHKHFCREPKRELQHPHCPAMDRVAAIILSGGQGKRLYPLTMTRCKPALSFGGPYRLIDVPISNCIHSGCDKIFILTQFLSSSLHQHIFNTYRFDSFSKGYIELLPAEQRLNTEKWFQGTADAVRQNLEYFFESAADYFLVLSGDQLYNTNFSDMVDFARQTDADVVISSLPVSPADAKRMGILEIDGKMKVKGFCEKPQEEAQLEMLRCNPALIESFSIGMDKPFLGSMGIYLFKRQVLIDLLLTHNGADFGQHLIPHQVSQGGVFTYLFDGYWEDIGTIESFYKANIALTTPCPEFKCHLEQNPIFRYPYQLPAAKLSNTLINHSIICEGSIVNADEVSHSILGPRTVLKAGCVVESSYIMGHDFYIPPVRAPRLPQSLSIGEGTVIRKAVIDKHVSIGSQVQLVNKKGLDYYDSEHVYIRDGIIVVPRGAVIPDSFTL